MHATTLETPTAPTTVLAADTMKAIVQDRYGSSEVLELRNVDKPAIGDHDVLVRVCAAAVNPGDSAIMSGLPYIARPAALYGLRRPKNPIRGTDVAGHVEAVGAGVTRFRPGDEVFGWCRGAFAEYASASEYGLALKPSNISFEQAAALPMAGSVALQALRDHGKVQAGQRILINGASGGIGTFAVQIAKSLGADVTGVCSTPNVDLVRSIALITLSTTRTRTSLDKASITTSFSTTRQTRRCQVSAACSPRRECWCRTAEGLPIVGSPVLVD